MNNLRLKVETIVAKGEIARFEQFFFCHYVFKKSSATEASESVYMRERVKSFIVSGLESWESLNISYVYFVGFKLSSSTIAALVFKYSNIHDQISVENFLCCLAKLLKLFSKWWYYINPFPKYRHFLRRLCSRRLLKKHYGKRSTSV